MGLFRKNKKSRSLDDRSWKITESCLSLILESSKSTYPKEFGGLLRVDDDLKNTITEIVLLPGTIAGDSHAIFKMHMAPFDQSIVGTIHSHPSPSFHPSEADKQLFRKYGKIHMIVAYPFSENTWMAYDASGEKVKISVM